MTEHSNFSCLRKHKNQGFKFGKDYTILKKCYIIYRLDKEGLCHYSIYNEVK
jgi:hypothetical protein